MTELSVDALSDVAIAEPLGLTRQRVNQIRRSDPACEPDHAAR